VRDDLKAEGLAVDNGSRTYGFADGLASGDGWSRYRTARDKEHTDKRMQVGECAAVACLPARQGLGNLYIESGW
jgi:hypothetical protein